MNRVDISGITKSGILETERLILRGWSEDDAPSLYKYASDGRVGPAAGWVPHTGVDYSRAIIRTVLAKDEIYAICLKGGNDEPVGSIGLTFKDCGDGKKSYREAELGYWVGVPYWGQGIATEAANEVLRHGFEDIGPDKIYCAYFSGNELSKRVQDKCGFRPHHVDENCKVPMLGEVRTEYINLLTRAQWEAS